LQSQQYPDPREREKHHMICQACGSHCEQNQGGGRPRQFCLVCSPRDPVAATRKWHERNLEYTAEYNASRRIPRDQWKKSSRVFVAHEVSCSGGCGTTVTTRGARGRCAECQAITMRERNRRKNYKRRGARYQIREKTRQGAKDHHIHTRNEAELSDRH
jgi:hypothetical protein